MPRPDTRAALFCLTLAACATTPQPPEPTAPAEPATPSAQAPTQLQTLTTFASQIVSVAVGWQIYDLTRDPFDLGMVGLGVVSVVLLVLWPYLMKSGIFGF